MHPEIARTLAAQHHEDLAREMRGSRQAQHGRRFQHWTLTWSRTILSPGDVPTGATAPRKSWVIIISANRPA
jgi:hypothetical protein